MIIPDINLLLYATFSRFPEHARSRRWWEDSLSTDIAVGIPSVSLFGFIRLATSARVIDCPMKVEEALKAVESWLEAPRVTFLIPGPDHLQIAFRLMRELGTASNLTTDIQLAAFAIENQAELFSNDSDFGRFGGLRWKNPLKAKR